MALGLTPSIPETGLFKISCCHPMGGHTCCPCPFRATEFLSPISNHRGNHTNCHDKTRSPLPPQVSCPLCCQCFLAFDNFRLDLILLVRSFFSVILKFSASDALSIILNHSVLQCSFPRRVYPQAVYESMCPHHPFTILLV